MPCDKTVGASFWLLLSCAATSTGMARAVANTSRENVENRMSRIWFRRDSRELSSSHVRRALIARSHPAISSEIFFQHGNIRANTRVAGQDTRRAFQRVAFRRRIRISNKKSGRKHPDASGKTRQELRCCTGASNRGSIRASRASVRPSIRSSFRRLSPIKRTLRACATITSCPNSLNTRLTHGECVPVSNAIRLRAIPPNTSFIAFGVVPNLCSTRLPPLHPTRNTSSIDRPDPDRS